jgi:hypothetical protein
MEMISMTVQQFSHFVPAGTPIMFQGKKAKKANITPVQVAPPTKDSVQLRSSHSKRGVTFGSDGQDKDPTLKDAFKAKWRKFKKYAERKLEDPNVAKKAGLAAGVVTFFAVEAHTFGASGGVAGKAAGKAAEAAVVTYVGTEIAKSQVKKNPAPPPPPPPRTDRHSEGDDYSDRG